jgi:serine/threonine protein kinase
VPEQLCPNCNKPYQPGDEVCRTCGFILPITAAIIESGKILQTRYEIQELVHSGGMGYVYLATDKRLYDRICIVKQIKEPIKSEAHRKKLEEEALRMAKLDHPNVAMILDHFIDGGYYFLVVERIHGKTLSEVFKEHRGHLTENQVIGWAISICDVVSYLHHEGIVHRDISPDNIMLTGEGSIKFIDFGTLRELRYIVPGGTAGMGKYGYTPPEQWQGKPEFRSDIFALGATIYYLLSGFLPLSREYLTRQAPQKADFNPNFPPIRTKNPSVSPQLEAVLQKALQLDVNDRYSSVEEFGAALRNLGQVEVKKIPILSLETRHLDFANVTPRSTVTKPIILKNIGNGKLTGKLTTSQPWLKVSPSKIATEHDEWKGKVTVDAKRLAPGLRSAGEINVATNGGQSKIAIDLSVAVEARPEAISKPKPIIKPKLVAKPKPVIKPKAIDKIKSIGKPKLKVPLRWTLMGLGILFLIAGAGALYFTSSHPATPSPAPLPTLAIQGVSTPNIDDSSAVLAWTTNKPATSQVKYGLTADLEWTTPLGQELVTSHSIQLNGLQSITTYFFSIISKDANGTEAISDIGQFTTLRVTKPDQESKTAPASTTWTPGPTPAPPTAAELSFKAKTYTNDKYGFSFQYPSDWEDYPDILTTPYHLAAFDVLNSNGRYVPGVTALAFDADAPESNDWIIKSFGLIKDKDFKLVSDIQEETLADGTKAYTYKVQYDHPSGYKITAYTLDADRDGKRIRIIVYTVEQYEPYNEKLFSEIAHTLAFTDAQPPPTSTPVQTPTPPAVTVTSFKAKTYTNDKYGFSIQYPSDWVERPELLTTPYHLAAFGVENSSPVIAIVVLDANAPESKDWIIKSIGLLMGKEPKLRSAITEETTPDGSKAYTYRLNYIISTGYEIDGYVMDVDRGAKRLRFQACGAPVNSVDYNEKLYSEIVHTVRFTAK